MFCISYIVLIPYKFPKKKLYRFSDQAGGVVFIDADFQAITKLDLKLGSIPRLVFME